MKPTTLLAVAFSFLAGLGLGLSGPLAKAADGLWRVMGSAPAGLQHADRITASFDTQRGAFQPADFRWPLQEATKTSVVCRPKADLAHQPIQGVHHL